MSATPVHVADVSAEVGDPDQPGREDLRLRPWMIGLVVWVVLAAVLAVHSRDAFDVVYYEGGDFGVNSILIDQAKELELLVGNYSRVGFNHPGPAFLYVQAVGEVVLHDLVPLTASPFGAHRLSAILLSSAFVAMAATIVEAHTRKVLPSAVLAVTALVYSGSVVGMMASTWMPHLYVWPFLLMLVSGASILAGRYQSLWMFVLAASFLVHGHVSFVLFVGATTLVVGAAIAKSWRRDRRWPVPRGATTAAAGIVVLFVLPLVINLALNWPGQFDRYLDYSSSVPSGGKPLREVVSYVKDFWADGPVAAGIAVLAVVVLAGIILRWREMQARGFALALLAMVALSTACTLVYAVRGVDDLSFDYIAQFYVTAPMLAIVVASIVATEAIVGRSGAALALAFLVLAAVGVWAARQPTLAVSLPAGEWVPAATEAVEAAVDGEVALQFEDGWPEAAALVEQWRREGDDVCVVDGRIWPVLFTDEMICSEAELEAREIVEVLPPSSPRAAGELVRNDAVVLRLVASES